MNKAHTWGCHFMSGHADIRGQLQEVRSRSTGVRTASGSSKSPKASRRERKPGLFLWVRKGRRRYDHLEDLGGEWLDSRGA